MNKLSSNTIKFIKSLHQKKYRDEHNLFIVEGEKLVNEALNSNFKIKEIYKKEDIGEEAMERVSALSSPSPILAIVEKRDNSNIDFLPKDTNNQLVLALDGIKDPGNLGTIIRIADWFGIETIIASIGTVELYNPKVIQSTMGAIFRKNIIYCNLVDELRRYKDNGSKIFGTFLDGDNIYNSTKLQHGIIVIGSESNGISNEISRLITERITIPSFAINGIGSESLNAAVATGIVCSEFKRRGL